MFNLNVATSFSGGLDSGEVLVSIIKTMDKFMKGNFPSALMMIGGVGLTVHYEQLVKNFDGVPLILAWSKPVSGKTTAANVAMSIIGQREHRRYSTLEYIDLM